MYLRLSQSYLAAGDAYIRCYDKIIMGIWRKIKIVENHLIYDTNIQNDLYNMWDYLLLCAQTGIVINEKKFKFCRDTIEFAGLKLTPNDIAPSDTILSVIKDFQKPTDQSSSLGLLY